MIDLEKNYIDLAKWFESKEVYTDWEGFADPEPCMELMKRVELKVWPEAQRHWDSSEKEKLLRKICFTLTLHWVYETLDSYDLPSEEETVTTYYAIEYVLGSRWWMKEDV